MVTRPHWSVPRTFYGIVPRAEAVEVGRDKSYGSETWLEMSKLKCQLSKRRRKETAGSTLVLAVTVKVRAISAAVVKVSETTSMMPPIMRIRRDGASKFDHRRQDRCQQEA